MKNTALPTDTPSLFEDAQAIELVVDGNNSNWKEYRLTDILDLIGGGTPKTNIAEYWGGDIGWLSVTDFNNGRKYCFDAEKKITQEGLLNSSTKLLKKGQIIISARGTVGALAVIGKEMAFNQSCYGVDAKKSKIENNFLYYALKFIIPDLINNSHGAVFDTITRDTFSQLSLLLPPLPEQRAIASVLSSLDDKIDLLHRQNATLEQLAQTLFRQWFVEEAKEEWEVKTLGDVVSIKGGTTPSTKDPSFWDGEIHWTTPRDLSNHTGIYLFDTDRKISKKGLNEIGSGLLPIGSVLLSSRAPIGYLAINAMPVAINQGYIGILCDSVISNYFMYLWCKQNMEEIKNSGNGSVFMEISKSVFKQIPILLPDKDKMKEFDEIIVKYFDKIKNNQIQIRTLTQLRDSLLPRLMSGEIRVQG